MSSITSTPGPVNPERLIGLGRKSELATRQRTGTPSGVSSMNMRTVGPSISLAVAAMNWLASSRTVEQKTMLPK